MRKMTTYTVKGILRQQRPRKTPFSALKGQLFARGLQSVRSTDR